MNNRDLNLFFCLGMLVPIVLVGISIRSYFDNQQYIFMLSSIGLAVVMLLIARFFYNNSRKNDDNGGLKITQ